MSSIRIKKERRSPERHRRRSRSRSRSRSRERIRIKKEKPEDSHRNGDHGKRERRDHRNHRRDDVGQSRERHGSRNDDHQRVKQERVKQEREYNDEARRRDRKHRPQNPFTNSDQDRQDWGRQNDGGGSQDSEEENPNPAPKDQPNFGVSGKLAEDTNTFRGVVIKYNEPPEARIPKRRWRFYVFKGEETLPVLHLHRQSAYLLGRDRKIADMPIDHPSCSKQHAVFQYRLVDYQKEDGTIGRRIRPYIIDLESANGTFLNNKKIDPKRYYELQEKDVIKFGFSTREYVLLHANSKDTDDDMD
ncbi:smad nuclear-interacting protein 1-like [Amphiura filiformis]|uniref:smad nuclear-interacting protein 1-like n=1 Tax=Amphiura filiformis TaxID=82378 RepID=UPI003B215113